MPTERERARARKRLERIWREVAEQHPVPISAEIRAYVSELCADELSLRDDRSAAELLTLEVDRLQKHGLGSEPAKRQAAPESVQIPDGERWQLLYDLGRRFEGKFAGRPETQELHGFDPMTLEHYEDSASYPPSQRIRVVFDAGMNLATVMALLKREFRERYRPKGWVRTTRPLGERALTLVRFVCLESQEGLSWRARLPLWNARYPQWAYPDARRFQAAFRRAELQLTGLRGALSALYITLDAYDRAEQQRREQETARIEAYYEALDAFPEANRSDIEWLLDEHPGISQEELGRRLEQLAQEDRELAAALKERSDA